MDPGPPATPEAVLSAVRTSLEEAARVLDDPPSLQRALADFSSAAAPLSTFELEFGVAPAQVPGWHEIQTAARALLGFALGPPPAELYLDRGAPNVVRATLLVLAGVHTGAMALLDIRPRGRCGNLRATVRMEASELRSELYELAGDHAAALRELEVAVSASSLALGEREHVVLHARYGHLLVKNGRAAAGHAVLQRVVDLFPHKAGGRLSRRALERDGALVAPTAARILDLYANRRDDTDEHIAGVIALGAHRFPESFDILVARLEAPAPPHPGPAPRPPAPKKRGRVSPSAEEAELALWQSRLQDWDFWKLDRGLVLFALGHLGDRRAIPYLQRAAEGAPASYAEGCARTIERIASAPAG